MLLVVEACWTKKVWLKNVSTWDRESFVREIMVPKGAEHKGVSKIVRNNEEKKKDRCYQMII
jgi:hypothetical protein